MGEAVRINSTDEHRLRHTQTTNKEQQTKNTEGKQRTPKENKKQRTRNTKGKHLPRVESRSEYSIREEQQTRNNARWRNNTISGFRSGITAGSEN